MSDCPVFTCAICGGTFQSDWTDEEADAEYARTFTEAPMAPRAVACESCYQEILAHEKRGRR